MYYCYLELLSVITGSWVLTAIRILWNAVFGCFSSIQYFSHLQSLLGKNGKIRLLLVIMRIENSIFKYTLVIPLLQLYFYRHVTVICQGANSYRKKFPVSKALSSLQILTESFCMLLLQSYILANAWGAYPTVPIGRIINIGALGFIQIVKLLD